MEDLLHDYLIVDTNIFLRDTGAKLNRFAHHIVTVEDVIKEVKDEVSRHRLETLPYDLELSEPKQEDIDYTVRFSKETGDYRNLSLQDIKVIALAVRYVREKLPFLELAKHPGDSRKVMNEQERLKKIHEMKQTKSSKKEEKETQKNDEEHKSLTWTVPVKSEEVKGTEDPRFPKLGEMLNAKTRPKIVTQYDYDPEEEEHKEKVDVFAETDKENEEDKGYNDYNDYNEIFEEEEIEEEEIEEEDTEETLIKEEDNKEEIKEEEDKDIGKVRIEPNEDSQRTEFIVTKAPIKKEKEVEVDEDGFISVSKGKKKENKKKDDGFGEWITPTNYHQLTKKTTFEKNAIKPLRVVCMTSDYTMQNVMMQMGIRVMSVEGKMIRKIMKWMLKCLICQEQIFDMTKMFCPKCGYHDLRRISYYVLANGSIKENFNANKTLSKRGRIYNVTVPKGGKDKGIILTEDVYNERIKAAKRTAKKHSKITDGFGVATLAEKSVVIENGRKNPNVARRKIGKKNKRLQKDY
ncbi:Nin one binding (NOB1) Zn-ribbon like, putative [Entamoeba histolytica]|uniref:RNA-binding protein nob1, putative n=2 Tax=Entamoeba histolytica (strain ATCC 30459 / HM-1:IMSS / ABRM) TaxID=294381 RepID=N9TLB8_ENTH1|nr:RNA-binding protein nob1, putative [Entamoeba histolytica HM-1:IMSS-A]